MIDSQLLLVLPLICCLGAAVLGLLLHRFERLQPWITITNMTLLFGVSLVLLSRVHSEGILVAQMGGWEAPFGISLVADHLSAIMLTASTFIGIAVAIYALYDLDAERVRLRAHPLLNTLMLGICCAFLAGDLFNLYVWFEVLLISAFMLMALGNTPWQLEGAIKYAAINLFGSICFLTGIGLLFGMTGTLNMADLARVIPLIPEQGMVTAVAMLFVIAFGIKAALFPLFFWLPCSYHTPPVSISAIFSGLLTKVGVYALIRAFTLLFVHDLGWTHTLLLWLAGLTMVTGVLGAAAQSDFRRILSFHIISQIGYMIMGLALFTPLALIGSIFHIVHNIVVKTNLFLVAGVAERLGGTEKLKGIGGLYRSFPLLSILFVIPAFSLAGFPPLSGFWGKFMLARAGFEIGAYTIVAVALGVGLLSLYSMSKIWLQAFLPDRAEEAAPLPASYGPLWGLMTPLIILALGTLAISVLAAPFYALAASAAEELMNPTMYIEAVLGP